MSFIRIGLLSLSVVSSACGANVVFGEDGGEGGNGADGSGANNSGAGNQGGSTSTFNTTVSNPDTTTGIRDACEELCNQCNDPGCDEGCKQLYFPGCESEADALIRCAIENLGPDCELDEGACTGELFAFEQCAGNGEDCFSDFCEQGDDDCHCSGSCFGSPIEQYCGFSNNGQTRCECFTGDQFLGECEGDGFSCSIEEGCCRQFFLDG